jgi:HSP20 family protein
MLTTLFPTQFNAFDQLSRQMDRLWDTVMTQVPAAGAGSGVWPAVNVWRDDRHVFAEAELPGFSMDAVEVLATEDSLTIRGRRNASVPENATPIRTERTATQFERTIHLPVEIDADSVQASLSHGVLTITMPIAPEARPRQIPVKSAQPLPSSL